MTYERATRRRGHGQAVATCRHRIGRARRHDAAGVRLVAEMAHGQLDHFLELAAPGDWVATPFDHAWAGEQSWVEAYDVLHAWLAGVARADGDGERGAAAGDLLEGLAMLADLWELQVEGWFAARAA